MFKNKDDYDMEDCNDDNQNKMYNQTYSHNCSKLWKYGLHSNDTCLINISRIEYDT